ncbi:unnamed protein product [Didymodactylos carnosus]|uniref:Integrase catalytic domain-containing protein n=1 Tax=Didymodactylos carnosus TaxID=1234261 RepID=A0A813WD11_9BILA|nr:unnamed protein product [Didymodactylos carnosus]CAF3637199.1 unnamed protein product [Didymodactylos carnosus]
MCTRAERVHNCLPDYLSRNPTHDEDELMNTEYGLELATFDRHTHSGVVGVITRSAAKKQAVTTNAAPQNGDDRATQHDSIDDSGKPPDRVIPNHLDITKLVKEQQEDTDIQRKIQAIQQAPHKHPYVLADGILYKLLSRDRAKTKLKLIYLPKSMVQTCLRSYHTHATAAHFSVQRTYAKLKYKYWWPHMQQSVVDYINACVVCKQHNHSRQKKPGLLHPLPPPSGPFQVLGIDYCGPFSTTPTGNKYVLCLTDHFTRWVTAVAVPDCTAQTTAEHIFNDYICFFGVPTAILSDNGSHFQNQLMTALTQVLGHNHIYSTAYHPQTNGMIERFNATFVPQLAKLQDKQSNNWDLYLSSVVFAYNTGQHFSTGYSPFQLLFGCDAKLPPDAPPKQLIFNKPNDYFQQLTNNLKTYHQHARQLMLHNQTLAKLRYDRNRTDPQFQKGQLVLTRLYGKQNKLAEKFSIVPSRIVEVKHPVTPRDDIDEGANGDHIDCTCNFRPYKDPRQTTSWSLQKAFALGFGLYLNKKYTCSNWGGGIDVQLNTWTFHDKETRHQQKYIRRALEQYAINDVITIWFIMVQQALYALRKTTRIPPPLSTVAPRPPSPGITNVQTIAFYAPETEPVTPPTDNAFNEPVTVNIPAESEFRRLLPLAQNFTCALISIPDTAVVPVGDRVSGPTPTSSSSSLPRRPQQQRTSTTSRVSEHHRKMKNKVSSIKYHKKDYQFSLTREIYYRFTMSDIKKVLAGLGLKARKLQPIDTTHGKQLLIGVYSQEQVNEFDLKLHDGLFTRGHYQRLYGRD